MSASADRGAAVVGLETSAYRVPTDAPEADGTLSWDATTLVAVVVGAAGVSGIGWTYAPAAAAALVDELLAPVVVGRSAMDVTGCWEAMRAALRNAGRPGLGSMALSAVDVALWDLKARLLGVPLHRLWGAVRDTVTAYGSGGFTSYDDRRTAAQLEVWHEQGFRSVKIKIGESWGTRVERDLHRVALARRSVGDDTAVFVDANGAYQVGQAVRVGRALVELGVSWFEEPVTSDQPAGLAQVRDALECDVAAGEYCYDTDDAVRLLDARAVDCLQLDATRCGGYTGFLRAAAVAAAHHVEISAHCAPYLHLPVAAAAPGLRHVEWFHDHVRIEQRLLASVPSAEGGVLPLGEAPGHGWEVRLDALATERVT
ncbi:enolase C-terminal domain-like protein [Nocardioides cheoyonin]|uniref:enolase C-terminal domain-like protein n=1 Tax=Nocardioides cheoyonin TaxID=3156615 RepID=UPI0032B42636